MVTLNLLYFKKSNSVSEAQDTQVNAITMLMLILDDGSLLPRSFST